MNRNILYFVLAFFTVSGCGLDEMNKCGNGACECFMDTDGTTNISNCPLYIPEHSHATGCNGNKCKFACDENYIQEGSGNNASCIPSEGGCNSDNFKTPICSGIQLMVCDKTTQKWNHLYDCTAECENNQCTNTCEEKDTGKRRCTDGKYQVCEGNEYEHVWKDIEMPNSDKKECAPWIECSVSSVELDTGTEKAIQLFYYDQSGSPEAGKNFTIEVSSEGCVELSKDKLSSIENGADLKITAGNASCEAKLTITVEDDKELSLSIPVKVNGSGTEETDTETDTSQCDEKCKNHCSPDGNECAPWIECSEQEITVDAGLEKTVKLFYYDNSGSPKAGESITVEIINGECVSLTNQILLSGQLGTDLKIVAGDSSCETELFIKSTNSQADLSIPVTVRDPLDENHNNMYDALETASHQNEPCQSDDECKDDGFCDSFIGFRCSTPCQSDESCLKGFYCRRDKRCAAEAFETIWDVTQDNLTVTLPTQNASQCNAKIDWDDDSTDQITSCPTPNGTSHTYSSPGQYHIKITGSYDNWAFSKDKSIKTNPACDQFRGVVSFGPVGLAGKDHYVFFLCKNNDYSEAALDIPDSTKLTNMAYMFSGNTKFNQPIGNWDTSNVTNLSHVFENASTFNQPIGNWNTSKVTTLNHAFQNASSFNQDLDGWDTSNVEKMEQVFASASKFNGKVGNWNTGNVKTMNALFSGAESFNQPLEWNVAKAYTMYQMFMNAKSFNQAIKFSNIGTCKFQSMFEGAESFNHESINDWDVSKGNDFRYMFKNAKAFNQPLGQWKPNAISMDGMFQGAENFNQNISSWNPSDTKNISRFFEGATKYNQPLEWKLDTLGSNSNVTDMFKGTSIDKNNFCKTIKQSAKLYKYAEYTGVSFNKTECN